MPSLTTVDPMPTMIGESAADLVLQLLKNPTATDNVMITPTLRLAQSTEL